MEYPPVRLDEDNRFRVADTRVLLDVVVCAWHQGKTPEAIVSSFPSVNLNQVNDAIAYYITHRAEIDAYLDEMKSQAADFQRSYEARYPKKPTSYRNK